MPMMLMGGDDFDYWLLGCAEGRDSNVLQLPQWAASSPTVALARTRKRVREHRHPVRVLQVRCAAGRTDERGACNGLHRRRARAAWDDYADLLLFYHHRCKTQEETARVWKAFETAKRTGKARHIGVSNFNVHDLKELQRTAEMPIEVLEAHFGVGLMDFEVLEFARANNIHVAGFASTSEKHTDHPSFKTTIDKVAAKHGISSVQTMYAYLHHWNITVLSSCMHPDNPSKCADYYSQDLGIFGVKFSAEEMSGEAGRCDSRKRTCTDCFTDECQACAHALPATRMPS